MFSPNPTGTDYSSSDSFNSMSAYPTVPYAADHNVITPCSAPAPDPTLEKTTELYKKIAKYKQHIFKFNLKKDINIKIKKLDLNALGKIVKAYDKIMPTILKINPKIPKLNPELFKILLEFYNINPELLLKINPEQLIELLDEEKSNTNE